MINFKQGSRLLIFFLFSRIIKSNYRRSPIFLGRSGARREPCRSQQRSPQGQPGRRGGIPASLEKVPLLVKGLMGDLDARTGTVGPGLLQGPYYLVSQAWSPGWGGQAVYTAGAPSVLPQHPPWPQPFLVLTCHLLCLLQLSPCQACSPALRTAARGCRRQRHHLLPAEAAGFRLPLGSEIWGLRTFLCSPQSSVWVGVQRARVRVCVYVCVCVVLWGVSLCAHMFSGSPVPLCTPV